MIVDELKNQHDRVRVLTLEAQNDEELDILTTLCEIIKSHNNFDSGIYVGQTWPTTRRPQ